MVLCSKFAKEPNIVSDGATIINERDRVSLPRRKILEFITKGYKHEQSRDFGNNLLRKFNDLTEHIKYPI